jgi:multiple sugar transport system permease protein
MRIKTMKIRRGLKTCLLLLMTLPVWVPVWMLVSGSFMGTAEVYKNVGPVLDKASGMAVWQVFPEFPILRPFVELLLDSPDFFKMFWNSCIQVFPVLLGQVCIAVPAAWAFARFRFKGKKVLYVLYILLMVLPFQVTMVSSYLVLDRLNLTETHLALIIPNIFSAFPVFIMEKFFRAVPVSLIEAAKLDGSGEFYIFIKVGVPIGAPGILSIVILGFLEYWNAIEQPLTFLVRRKDLWPLPLYLPEITAGKAGVAFAAAVIMMTPAVLLFLYGQKYLEQGIAASGLKE